MKYILIGLGLIPFWLFSQPTDTLIIRSYHPDDPYVWYQTKVYQKVDTLGKQVYVLWKVRKNKAKLDEKLEE